MVRGTEVDVIELDDDVIGAGGVDSRLTLKGTAYDCLFVLFEDGPVQRALVLSGRVDPGRRTRQEVVEGHADVLALFSAEVEATVSGG